MTDKCETDSDQLTNNLERLEALSSRFAKAIAKARPISPSLSGPGQDLYAKAAGAVAAEMIANPAKIVEQQVGYWSESLKSWMSSNEQCDRPADPLDKRFRGEQWDANPMFRLLKEQYLVNARTVASAVAGIEGLDPREKRRVEFFARQIVEMMSPANFLGTNPEALDRAAETEGASLVQGLENLVRDIERNDGDLLVTLADPDAFRVGENLATSPGSVVFRNELIELVQYAPSTSTVRRVPLLIVPPWINKFYVLDLKPENSFIKWAVGQGFTVFTISWVNPGLEHREFGLDAYAESGLLAAIDGVRKITSEERVNAVGYCIGGTLLALVLAYLSQTGSNWIRSATFFATLTDFEDPGELEVFLSDDFIRGLDQEMATTGYLPAKFMSRTFSYMRAGDLVYGPAVRSYLMGQPPPAFDLLYWNGDATNLPARMAQQYLHQLCRENQFCKGNFRLLGKTVSLRDIRHPLMMIACETDHIADWRCAYAGYRKMGSRDKTFVLSQSGHVAGIINPPSKQKYGHYMNSQDCIDEKAWRSGAEFSRKSWWPRWAEWLGRRSGRQMEPREPGSTDFPPITPAPGSYVALPSGDA